MELRATPQSSTFSQRPGPSWTSRTRKECQGAPPSALLSPGRAPRTCPRSTPSVYSPGVTQGSPLGTEDRLDPGGFERAGPSFGRGVPRKGLRRFRAWGSLHLSLLEGCGLAHIGGGFVPIPSQGRDHIHTLREMPPTPKSGKGIIPTQGKKRNERQQRIPPRVAEKHSRPRVINGH